MKKFFVLLLLVTSSFSCDSLKKMGSGTDLTALLMRQPWVLESLLGQAVSDQDFGRQLPFLQFGENGLLNGSTGCNNFSGNFKSEGQQLALNPGGMTKMACAGEGEKTFLNALSQVSSAQTLGNKLQLLAADGQLLMQLLPKP